MIAMSVSLRKDVRAEEFLGIDFLGLGSVAHEYLKSSGIVQEGEDTYKISIVERDNCVYVDMWRGDYDPERRFFDSSEYIDSVYDSSLEVDDIPETSKEFEDFTREYIEKLS
ncbi:MAG: hypothetical protein ACLFTA_03800 [Candidatus Nanohaloarchaea archaeon]